MTPQPSPNNLSDELKEKIRNIIIPNAGIAIAWDKAGERSDEAIAAITAAYAEAIKKAKPERRDTIVGHYKCAACGEEHDISQPLDSADNAYNAAIDTFTANLIRDGLLPNNASDEGSATE